MRKKIVQKSLGVLLAALLLLTPVFASGETETVMGDGGVIIGETIRTVPPQSAVTITVTPESVDWLDEAVWKTADPANIVYCSEGTIDENGRYEFRLALPESGLYHAYISIEGLDDLIHHSVRYINTADNTLAIGLLNDAMSVPEVAGVLSEHYRDLGLFGEVYEEYDYSDAAQIVLASLEKPATAANWEDVTEVLEKAVLADLLNKNALEEIDEYAEIVYTDDNGGAAYYKSQFSAAITEYMSAKDISSVDMFDELAIEALVLANINENDGITVIKNILIQYADELNINTSKITNSLCSAIANRGGFSSISELQSYIEDYDEPQTGGSSGGGLGGSGGSGGVSGGSHVYTGTESEADLVTVNTEFSAFSDISDVPWAEEAINALYRSGVINGREEGRFYPNDTIQREEYVKMIALAFRMNLIDDVAFPFTDVASDDWCFPYIKTAYLAGVVNGISADEFGVGQDITRQDLCVMTINALNALDMTLAQGEEKVFADADAVSDYARDAVRVLSAAGIVNGDETGSFRPHDSATRAEAAKIIYLTLSNAQ